MADVVLTKLFDVANGNGAARAGTDYPSATLIAFRDGAAKTAIINAFADAYSYQDTINGEPNPQSKQAFYNQKLTQHIRDIYKSRQVTVAAAAATATATTAAEAELPPG